MIVVKLSVPYARKSTGEDGELLSMYGYKKIVGKFGKDFPTIYVVCYVSAYRLTS